VSMIEAVQTRGKIAFRGDQNADPRRRMVVCVARRNLPHFITLVHG
jgi:hypothetical protein